MYPLRQFASLSSRTLDPSQGSQCRRDGYVQYGFSASTVLRLLTPLMISYDDAKKRADRYTKIVGELPEMRRQTVELVRIAVADGWRAYVLVNNRIEENAIQTVQEFADALGA